MIAHVSKWVLPVSRPPIRDGVVLVRGDAIQAVGPAKEVLSGFKGLICDHGAGVILPGLVNCHTHLEFSALAGRIFPQERWEAWLEMALAEREALAPAAVDLGIRKGIEALRRGGTALVGEVSNTGASLPPLDNSPLEYHLFYECLGFNLRERVDLAESFPFLAGSGAAKICGSPWRPMLPIPSPRPCSGPSAVGTTPTLCPKPCIWGNPGGSGTFGGGPRFFPGFAQRRGRWVEDFQAPGTSPVAYLHELDFLGPRTLAVHGVWLDDPDCRLSAESQTWLVLCPRANRYTGAGVPPVEQLLRAGLNLALAPTPWRATGT